ncbi:MAG TPA: TonB family protein [Hyphomonadaceae bacterium]|jgi:protein TonB|nr:TonB family protein [Hyphomonadaceae bacterium]
MYGTMQRSGGRARMTGIITAAALTVGAGYVFTTGLANDFIPELQKKMEVFIMQPEKPKEVEKLPDPPKVEKVKPIDVPPPELVAPDIPIVSPEPPVITAPPAPPEPVLATPPAPPAPAAPDTRPKLQTSSKPEYPAASIRASEQGTTKLEVCVSAQGRVTSVNVTGSSGSSRLDQAAASWLQRAKFSPAVSGGQPTALCGHPVIYQWNLEDARR